ncbi:hypothetical protein [Vibrio alginolyticus]|uniref:hypothetical protein n=1 Tax=Vibrio alginolyticus TaxID=663 RepID=UPI0037543FA7
MNYEFLKPKELKIEIRKPNQKYTGIIPEHSVLAAFTSLATNALLRGEQRNTKAAAYHLKHQNQRIVKMPRVANPS